MGWLTPVMAVIGVIERLIPVVERLMSTLSGAAKHETVKASAEATIAATLPQIDSKDPELQRLIDNKIQADVALANYLQAHAHPLSAPLPMTSGAPLEPDPEPGYRGAGYVRTEPPPQ